MFKKLDETIKKYEEITAMLSTPEVAADPKKIMEYNKALSKLEDIVEKYKEYKKTKSEFDVLKEDVKNEKDDEMREMMNEEIREMEPALEELEKDSTILYAVSTTEVQEATIPEPIKQRIINGINRERSGDIQLISHDSMLPTYAKTGTTHSVWNSYDSHIPLIFMGWGIEHGESNKPYFMTDIAPTVSALLHIQFPSGNVGNPITEVLGK